MYSLKVMQMNIGRNQEEMNELIKHAQEEDIEIIFIQEPYTNSKTNLATSDSRSYRLISKSTRSRSKAAIAVKSNMKYLLDDNYSDENHVTVVINEDVYVSSYLNLEDQNNKREIENDLNLIQGILDKYNDKSIFIFTDSNSRHQVWGDRTTNKRGEILFEFVLQNNLEILNDPLAGPTYIKYANDRINSSNIDLTLVNQKAFQHKIKWSFDNRKFNTEHLPITIMIQKNNRIEYHYEQTKKINYRDTDWGEFMNVFRQLRPSIDLINQINLKQTIAKFDQAIAQSIQRQVKTYDKEICIEEPWSNEIIKDLRFNIARIRRKLTKLRGKSKYNDMKTKEKELSKRLIDEKSNAKATYYEEKHKIDSETKFWREWRMSQRRSPDLPVILNGNESGSLQENNQKLKQQFIKDTKSPYQSVNLNCNRKLKETNIEELNRIINHLDDNRAPGPDQITNKLIKIIYKNDQEYMTEIFNKVLKHGKLPDKWKIGRLIYFKKPGRIGKDASDYRPITLINGFCKIAEKLIITRIEEELNDKNYLSDTQFGFRYGKSTVSAIDHLVSRIKQNRKKYKYNLLVTADISGAFDGISWTKIVNNLIKSKIKHSLVMAGQSLLTNRRIKFQNGTYKSSRGCPQGGKASPSLWTIGMNDLLTRLNELENSEIVAFADDLAVLISSNSKIEIQSQLNKLWSILKEWCSEAELELNMNKTEFVNFTRLRNINLQIAIEGIPVQLKDEVKYLGVILDHKLLWNKHVDHLTAKTDQLLNCTRRFLWWSRDTHLYRKLNIYSKVFLPKLMYASEVWYTDLKDKKTYVSKLNRLQRRIINTLTGAYRSTCTEKLYELIGVCELSEELYVKEQLKSVERERRKSIKIELKNNLLECKKSYNFDLDVVASKSRFVIWWISNRGPFRDFLNRIKIPNVERWCRYCYSFPETSYHLLFECEQMCDRTNLDSKTFTNIVEFEKFCINYTKKLFRDEYR